MGVDLLAGAGHAMAEIAAGRAPRVAVFDSGVGGLTVYREVAAMLAGADIIYLADSAGFPYGPLDEQVLVARVVEVIGRLIERCDPDLVVIACNTASTLALPVLRSCFAVPFVGTVPAIKPAAALSKSRLISVLATPGTVRRDYTRELVAAHAGDCAVTLVGSSKLAGLAERELAGDPARSAEILEEIEAAFVSGADGRRTDAVVLACTHYPLLADRFRAVAPWPVAFVDPAPAIARRVAALVGAAAGQNGEGGRRALFTGGHVSPVLQRALQVLGLGEAVCEPVPFMRGDAARC